MSEYEKIDVHGRPISLEAERRSELMINSAIACCSIFTALSGGYVFTLFMKEWFNASAKTIGLISSLTIGMPIFGLLGAQIVERLGRRKPCMVISYFILRTPYIFIALTPLLGQSEKSLQTAVMIIIAVVIVSRLAMGITDPAWWSWIGDLIPQERHSRFFAQQQRFSFAAGIVSFLVIAVLLDQFGGMKNKVALITVLCFGVLAGVIESLLYCFVPEPKMVRTNVSSIKDSIGAMFEPFKHKAFLRLIIVIGLYNFFLQITLPFQPLYLRGTEMGGQHLGLNASYKFVLFLPMITSIVGLLSTKLWGVLGDKLGSKLLLLMGVIYWFPFLAYFVVSPENYMIIIIVAVAVGSFLQPAWAVGQNSAILQISPQANRSAYGAAYLVCFLAMTAPAPYVGGWLADRFAVTGWTLPNGMPFSYIHLLTLISAIGMLIVIALLNRIPVSGHRPWKEIFATLLDVRLFYTLAAMRTLSHSKSSAHLIKALKRLSGTVSRMAIKEVIPHLDSEDKDVRREAAAAIGRMGTPDEITGLVRELYPTQEDIQKKVSMVIEQKLSNIFNKS